MRNRPRSAIFVLAVVPFLLFAGSGEAQHGSGTMDFLGKVINFLLLFGGLAYVLRKPIRGMLEKRVAEVRSGIEGAENSRISARDKFEASAARFAGIDDETVRVKKDAEAEGSREKERISALARAEAERIRKLALQEIDLQLKTRVQELRAYAAEAATRIAAENIRKKLALEEQSALIDRSIDRLSEYNDKQNSR